MCLTTLRSVYRWVLSAASMHRFQSWKLVWLVWVYLVIWVLGMFGLLKFDIWSRLAEVVWILRGATTEEVEEDCRRKSASSSIGIFFRRVNPDSNPRPLDFCTGYLATVPYEKGSRRCWYDWRISFYTVRFLNIQWYLVSTLVSTDDFSSAVIPPVLRRY